MKAATRAMLCSSIISLAGAVGCALQSDTGPAAPDFWDPIPQSSSTTPPDRIQDGYWRSQFERVNREIAASTRPELVFFGDSITLGWTHLEAKGKTIWEQRFAKHRPINMGNSGDITPVMLYRVTHGNLDFAAGNEPRVAVLLCGTNNYVVEQSAGGKVHWDLGPDTPPSEVADGVRALAQEFRRRLPQTRVIVLGILPVKQPAKWARCQQTNRLLAAIDYPDDEVVFLDLQQHFVDANGLPKAELYTDGTHLTTAGYEVMADAIGPTIERLMAVGPIPIR